MRLRSKIGVFLATILTASGLTLIPPTTVQAADQGVKVNLTEIEPLIIEDQDTVTVKATVTNDTTDPLTGEVAFRLANDAFGDLKKLHDWSKRGVDDFDDVFQVATRCFGPVGRCEQGELAAKSSQEVTFAVPTSRLGLENVEPGWGPRGIVVDFTPYRSGPRAAARSYVISAPPKTAAPISLSLAVPLSPSDGGGARTLAAIDATASHKVDWLIDPASLEDPLPGKTEETYATHVNEGAQGRTLFALPYGDPDLGALAQANAHHLLQEGIAESSAVLTASNIPARSDLVWSKKQVDRASLDLVGSIPNLTIAGAATNTAPFTTPGSRALTIPEDPVLGKALAKADTSKPETMRSILAILAQASMAQATNADAPQAVVGIIPRESAISQRDLDGALTQIESLSWVKPTSLATLIDKGPRVAGDVGAAKETSTPIPVSLVKEMDEAIVQAGSYCRATDATKTCLSQASTTLLEPLGYRPIENSGAEAKARQALKLVRSQAQSLAVEPGSDVNQISTHAEIPIVVRNSGEYPVKITIKLTPSNSSVKITDQPTLTVGPESSATARVGIEALRNGQVELQARMTNSAGEPVSTTASKKVRVHAEWENLGTLIAAGALGLFMVWGLFRTIKKHRRRGDVHTVGEAG